MMNAKRMGIVLGAALLLPAALAPAAQANPDPDAFRASETAPEFEPAPDSVPAPKDVSVEVETINGSGCPAGTTKVTPTDDNTAFTVVYQKYVAWGGGDAPPTESRKNCQINVKVNAPKGYTYAVIGVVSRGFAHVEPDATALRRTNYYFQGNAVGETVSHVIEGPHDGAWRFRDRTDTSGRIYKPCDADRNLNINTELRINKGDSDSDKPSFIAMESANANAVYHLTWKRC